MSLASRLGRLRDAARSNGSSERSNDLTLLSGAALNERSTAQEVRKRYFGWSKIPIHGGNLPTWQHYRTAPRVCMPVLLPSRDITLTPGAWVAEHFARGQDMAASSFRPQAGRRKVTLTSSPKIAFQILFSTVLQLDTPNPVSIPRNINSRRRRSGSCARSLSKTPRRRGPTITKPRLSVSLSGQPQRYILPKHSPHGSLSRGRRASEC